MNARPALLLAALLALAGCAERGQHEDNPRKKADTPAYGGAADAFQAAGWKAGDETSWEQQLRRRSQGQNEYVRIGAR